MSKPTVTELLANLRKENKNNITLTDSEQIDVEDTITEVHTEEFSNHQDIYDLIEELSEKIKKLEEKITKIEKEKATEKYYKEKIEYVEQNKMYNDFFDIPLEQRTYKPIVKKEEINPNIFKTTNRLKEKINNSRIRSQSKRRKYK